MTPLRITNNNISQSNAIPRILSIGGSRRSTTDSNQQPKPDIGNVLTMFVAT